MSSSSRHRGTTHAARCRPLMPPMIRGLRVVVGTDDYDRTLSYLQDVLGLRPVLAYDLPDDDRVTILDVGPGTLEIATTAHLRAVDATEGTNEPGPQFRLALHIDDAAAAARSLVAAGAAALAAPTATDWGSLNARVALADGVQLTLFQPLDDGAETGPCTTTGAHHE